MTKLDPTVERQADAAVKYCEKADHEARLHSGLQFLAALGVGLAAGAIFYALRPEPKPRARLVKLVTDIEKRLLGMSRPALRKAQALAADSADAVSDGEVRVEHFLRDATRRVRGIWS